MRSGRWRRSSAAHVSFDLPLFFAAAGDECERRNHGQRNDCNSGAGELHPGTDRAIAMPFGVSDNVAFSWLPRLDSNQE